MTTDDLCADNYLFSGSMSVNVSVTFGRDEFINAGQLSVSSSSKNFLLGLVPPLFEALVAQIIAFLIL